jgi:hypothetical protein
MIFIFTFFFAQTVLMICLFLSDRDLAAGDSRLWKQLRGLWMGYRMWCDGRLFHFISKQGKGKKKKKKKKRRTP